MKINNFKLKIQKNDFKLDLWQIKIQKKRTSRPL